MEKYENETIAAIATALSDSGIGIVRISGENAIYIIDNIFRSAAGRRILTKVQSHTIHYGYIVDSDENVIDEVMVAVMKAPRSYTTEDTVEINCHGGVLVMQKVLEAVLHAGARLAQPGEFTKRAFLNGRIDLSRAEAVIDVIHSQNEYALSSSVSQLKGQLSNKIHTLREDILYQIAFIESALDDPEHISLEGFGEKLRTIINGHIDQLNKLLLNFEDGRMKSEGINTVIVGRPNAGKSSLMNLMLEQERAIVTNIAGTTRDVLEEKVVLGNIILNLIDTAGIHETKDVVENMGVDKAVDYLSKADFVIYVVDASESLDKSDEQIIHLLQDKKGVVLFNKSDLNIVLKEEQLQQKLNWSVIPFSNETKQGLEQLKEYITNSFLKGNISYNDQIYLTSIRHRNAVEAAVNSLKQVVQTVDDGMPEDFYTIDMMEAYRSLGLINGETASEDLVNKIFSDFCMGK